MNEKKQYDDSQWRIKIEFANKVFNKGELDLSVQHYQVAIKMGQKLFSDYQHIEPLPDALTPVLVVSYLNLADCWAKQHKKKEQILCLIEIYDFLKTILNDSTASPALAQQTYNGLSKIFLELCICFKAIDAQQELLKTEENFSELSTLYQSQQYRHQSNTLH